MNNQVTKRQIDKLGRIVIPKNIRKQANFNDRDYINISCNNNVVNLEKDNCNDKLYFICDKIINHLYSIFHNDMIVTDKEKIIKVYGSQNGKLENKQISNEIVHMVNDSSLSISRLNSIEITDKEYLKGYYYIPIMEDNNIIGSIFIDSEKLSSSEIIMLIFKITNN